MLGHLYNMPPPDPVGRICDFWLMRRYFLRPRIGGQEQGSSQSRLRLNSTLPPGKRPAWWTADERWVLWRMRGKHGEPAEGSIVCRWPVRNSIIPPSHPLALSTAAAGRGSSSNNIISAHWTGGLIQSQPRIEIHHRCLLHSAKVCTLGFNTGWNWTAFKSIHSSLSPIANSWCRKLQ